MKWLFICFIFFICFISTLSSCDLSFLGTNRSRQYSLVPPEDGTANIPTGDFFFINIKSAFYTGGKGSFDPLDYVLYAMDEGPGTACKISVNEKSATEDLYCMLEISEGDLWYHEINLEYNVPPGMCSYLAFMPHWHYNQPTGQGQGVVFECEIQVPDGSDDQGRPKFKTEKRFSLNDPRPGKDCPQPYKEDAKKLCVYNQSGEDSELANCCYGKYTIIGGEGSRGDWGGDIKQCVGGFARLNWNTFDKDGFPGVLVTQTGSKGLNEEYKLKPLIDGVESSQRVSFPAANYISGMEDKDLENKPSFYWDNTTKNRKTFEDAPFTTWACLDQNKEVLHTIKLIIREWNTQEEFIRFKESKGRRGDPDIVGAEGSECDYYENNTLLFGDCDDLRDADTFGLGKPDCENDCKEVEDYCLGNKGPGCSIAETTCKRACTVAQTACKDDGDNTGEDTDPDCATKKYQCDAVCDRAKTACDSGCTGPTDTACLDACTVAQTACKDDGDNTGEDTDPDCATEKYQCDAVCDRAKSTCDNGCTIGKRTCDTVCQEVKSTCDDACEYPLINYK